MLYVYGMCRQKIINRLNARYQKYEKIFINIINQVRIYFCNPSLKIDFVFLFLKDSFQ